MEKQEIDGGVPGPYDWKSLPGDLVMRFEAGPGLPGAYGFEWQVKQLKPGVHFALKVGEEGETRYEASTPYRTCVYQGDTAEEAIGNLMLGMALLSRDGSINPNNPHSIGAPVIQHVIHVLTERLLWHVERRQDHLVMGGYTDTTDLTWPSPYAAKRFEAATTTSSSASGDDAQSKKAREDAFHEQMVKAVARDNDIVSALGTAISALARVKDL